MTDTPVVPQGGLDLPEAPASLNFRGRTSKGWDIQFTLRDWSEEALITRFGNFVALLERYHIEPEHPPMSAPPPAPSLGSALPNELPMVAGSPAPQKAEELSFEAELLVGSMDKGKRYWKVQGGKFKKFGVTIWPEAAKESGIDLDGCDISKTYELKNMVAHYIEKDGKPEKVTRLVYR